MAIPCGDISVWDVQSKVPLQTFTEVPWRSLSVEQPQHLIQFSRGNLGKEILVFVEVCLMFTF